MSPVITDDNLNVKNLLRLYESYLHKNRDWLLADAPVRKDLRIYEAVFHFNLYSYLNVFFQRWKGHVHPEFPTGNGQIDLLITYAGKRYGVEVKSFQDERSHKEGVAQAIRYGKQLALMAIVLVSFIEKTGIRVLPVFVATGV